MTYTRRRRTTWRPLYERGRELKIGTYKTQNNRDGRPQGMMSGQKGDLTGQKLFTVFHDTKRNETIFNLTRLAKSHGRNTKRVTVWQHA